MNASQGFVIELNDMHGKPRKQTVFDASGAPISGVEYHYKLTDDGRLDNMATVIKPDGSVAQEQIGVDYQMIADARESSSETSGFGVHFNSGVIAFFLPWAVPLPNWVSEKTRFRSIGTTKVINRYALLDQTEVFDNGSRVSTKNLAYDAETGEVLATRTTNEFNDPVFSFNFPAHWANKGMASAYSTTGIEFASLNISAGEATSTNNPSVNFQYFTPGDELALFSASAPDKRLGIVSQ